MYSFFPTRNPRAYDGHVLNLLVAALTLTLTCGAAVRAATTGQSWRIDETHTSIDFKINAVGFPTTHGHFMHYTGRILIDLERPAKSFTSFTVDSGSVDVGSQSFNDFVKSAVLLDRAIPDTVLQLDSGRKDGPTHRARCGQSYYAGRDETDYSRCECGTWFVG
jgi:YceI-like domain